MKLKLRDLVEPEYICEDCMGGMYLCPCHHEKLRPYLTEDDLCPDLGELTGDSKCKACWDREVEVIVQTNFEYYRDDILRAFSEGEGLKFVISHVANRPRASVLDYYDDFVLWLFELKEDVTGAEE